MSQTVPDFLGRAPAARVAARLDLGAGRAVAIWENRDARVSYDAPRGHTFSLYLKDGTGTQRLDAGGLRGWPGAVCVMPEGHRSSWRITTPFRFVHLYLPDDELRASFALTHECDARRLDLAEATFVQHPGLASALATLARAAEGGDLLLADGAMTELVGQLASRPVALRGGLPGHLLRRLDGWIEAHLGDPIRLADLAGVANLSEFHFQRMFRLSRGLSPHAWIARRRIARARLLLGGDQPIAEIALACGFSSQSHLTRVFRQHTGRTPAGFRDEVAPADRARRRQG
ncbi:helix-turn-helix transcriptional regulator [Roseospirillum parvum]|uniref:AraC family transcriptional regulator n=1 Tax=Roseospirillum parvum TaxID=83401 RepID=A0A1G7XTM6_9PROT|nr:AraC family transcriptional regulator [Roseospirillum parvum]SDG87548.1 AraC family transcriptional regulator [Roseospirillum parvum]